MGDSGALMADSEQPGAWRWREEAGTCRALSAVLLGNEDLEAWLWAPACPEVLGAAVCFSLVI